MLLKRGQILRGFLLKKHQKHGFGSERDQMHDNKVFKKYNALSCIPVIFFLNLTHDTLEIGQPLPRCVMPETCNGRYLGCYGNDCCILFLDLFIKVETC